MNHDGIITPEIQAEFLSKFAHLEGETIGQANIIVKYYTVQYDPALKPYPKNWKESGFKVIYYDGHPVQVERIGVEEAKTMAKCSKLKFGDL
jgi:hypothetical protein